MVQVVAAAILILLPFGYANIESCIELIYERTFKPTSKVMVLYEDKGVDFYKFEKFAKSVYSTFSVVKQIPYYQKYDGYILLMNSTQVQTVLAFLIKLSTWNPFGNAIVYYTGGEIPYLIKHLCKYRIYNVAILIKSGDDVEIYTYFPYEHEDINNPILNETLLDVYSNSTLKVKNFFPNKLKDYWRNSTVRISYMNVQPYIICSECGTGIDVQLVQIIQSHLGFKVKYDPIKHNNWGWKLPNGSYEGAISQLQTRYADFVIGHFHLRELDHMLDFEYTFSYSDDDLRWVIPSARPLSHWANLVHIFAPRLWLLIFFTLVFAAISWKFVGHFDTVRFFRTWLVVETPFMLFILVSAVPPRLPKKNSTKILYLVTFVFGFICTTVWQSHLIYYLTHETYEKQIQSVHELVYDSKLQIGIHSELGEMYKSSGTEIGYEIWRRNIHCDASHTCLDRTGKKRDLGNMLITRIYNYIIPAHYKNEKGLNLIDMLPEVVARDFSVFFFQKGHPMFPRINNTLLYLRAGGFNNRLDYMSNFNISIHYRTEIFPVILFEVKVLGLSQMQSAFWICLLGHGISAIAFFAELYIYKRKNKLHKS